MVYHMVMARREVLVQLDGDLVDALDQIAKERDTNRSELLRRAARLLVDAVDEQKADAELIEAYRKQPQDPEWIDALVRASLKNWPEW
jgi:metal-responsive CopG/Arc/MetJ family transcriptional regulator